MNTILESLRSDAPLTARQAIIDRATRGPVIRDKPHGVIRTWRTILIEGCELRNTDVSRLNLARVHISRGALRDGTCDGTRFAHLSDCVLENVTAIAAAFPRLSNCRFDRAELRNADFGPLLVGCSFKDSALTGAHFGQVPREWWLETQPCLFDNCDMTNCQATGANLSGSRFVATRLFNARLTRCILRDCEMIDADLSGANLLGAVIERTKLDGASLRGAVLSPREAAALREGGVAVRSARVVSVHEPDAFQRLASKLATLHDYLLKWNMLGAEGERDRIVVYADDEAASLAHAMAFKRRQVRAGTAIGVEREYHCSYAIDGARDVAKIFLDIACDYVGWEPDLASLSVSDVDDQVVSVVEALAREALAELTSAISP